MTVLAFTPDRNSPGKNDYTGAFKPEAQRFCTLFGGHRFEMQTGKPLRWQAEFICDTIRGAKDLEVLGLFCHGYTRRLQFAFTNSNVKMLAEALANAGCRRVALYACSTGAGVGPGGDGGFADALRDRMCELELVDCRVLAHSVSGHTTMNVKKRFFEGQGSRFGGTGGFDVVTPSSPLWKVWRRRMRDPRDMLRFRIINMTVAEIHEELSQS